MFTSSRMGWLGATLLAAIVIAGPAYGQDFRYLGRATSVVINGAPSGEVGAGGTDADGNIIEDKTCGALVTECFNESTTAGVVPDLLITSTATTVGGTRDAAGNPRQGFPRVESRAEGSVLLLPPDGSGIIVAFGPAVAIADSASGELTGEAGPVLLELGGNPITIPAGEGIEVDGLFTLFAHPANRITNEDGLAVIEVDGALLRPDPTGPFADLGDVVLGRAKAGIEIPFTEGGGGGNACSIARSGRDTGGLQLLGMLGLFWMIARSRRRTYRRRRRTD